MRNRSWHLRGKMSRSSTKLGSNKSRKKEMKRQIKYEDTSKWSRDNGGIDRPVWLVVRQWTQVPLTPITSKVFLIIWQSTNPIESRPYACSLIVSHDSHSNRWWFDGRTLFFHMMSLEPLVPSFRKRTLGVDLRVLVWPRETINSVSTPSVK